MRISAVILACAFSFVALCTQAQTAPGGPVPAGECGVRSKVPSDKTGVISDTQGVNLQGYIQRMYRITQSSWKPLIPKEVDAPVRKTGEVTICFKTLPNGRVMDGGMVLEGRSGDPALDRAAWGAIATSVFPPLPAEFKGPYLEVRFVFKYNEDRQQVVSRKAPKPPNLFGPVAATLGYRTKL